MAREAAEGGRGARSAFTLATFLPYRLSVAAAVVSDGLATQYGERFGLSIAEWRVLATIGEFGAVTASDIAAHAHIGKVKVSRAASALARRRLIGRRPDDRDGRQAHLSLTPEGRAMYAEVVRLARDYVGRLTSGLSAREAAILDAAIDKLTRRVGEMAAGEGASA